jgi:subtilisin family serine protease
MLGAAQAEQVATPAQDKTSRGVIVLPSMSASTLALLRPDDTSVLAGQKVTVEQVDAQVGALVSSATLPDADLVQALLQAGLAAELNHPRHLLPIDPPAEHFYAPQAIPPLEPPDEPDFWHLQQIGADLVHATGMTGDPATIVGVIDTGIDHSHPWFAGVLLPGFDFVHSDGNPDDQYGHGTHVAGIVHKICPRCRILPVKVIDPYNGGGDDYTIARGIRYARQQGATIIQISLGGPSPSTTMCQAIKAVEQQGATVVIAAGNAASSDAESIGYPALCSPDSLVVSATDRYDIPAWFSNYGPVIDLAAPGMQVWSAFPSSPGNDGLLKASGTSMAAPQVSGAAGLLWSANPTWSAAQIAARLIATGRDIGVLPGIDDVYGPRVDVAQAFGLLSRPVVVGMESTMPWVPRSGSEQERTVRVHAHVRGDAITAVQLAVTINKATEHLPMAVQSDGTYQVDYVVPKNTAYVRDIFLQVVAENNAGKMYGYEEKVVQGVATVYLPLIRW